MKIDNKKVATFITGLSALLPGCGESTSHPAPSPDAPVNQSLLTEDAKLPKFFSECSVRFRGVDTSEDMSSYLDKKYPKLSDGVDRAEGLEFAEKTEALCREEYLKREPVFLGYGVDNVAYRMVGEKLIFAANIGNMGNFDVTLEVDSSPTITAEKFGAGLDKLICLLNDFEKPF